MHWQEACNKSSTKTAIRFNPFDNIFIHRHITGNAFYHNNLGEYRVVETRNLEGYDDWRPDNPIQETTDENTQD